ncbi:hypothetical protein LCGC14_1224720 [marine sediment metagenome]|uniref:NTP pyrophosphohydrolase MazG putative catalytic core domain-containing protein n=1 Tax=marine sediment metagenome TaxID=412755 RepID=A0A0F9PEQ5_9ZZZZ
MSNPNDLPLDWFKNVQFEKLSLPKNVAKPHWLTMNFDELLHRLKEEVQELEDALSQGESMENVISECADVSIFATMLAHKARTS